MAAGQLDKLTAATKDRYVIERELGTGGMATVYLAMDQRHHRKVAIKVMRPEVASVLGAERFLLEIEILAALTHPHILPLHDSGNADSLLYYVMPYVEGQSLRERLQRDSRVGVAETVRLGRGLAMALDYAHRRGVVHRDIKPENILLLEGEPVLADFGIARNQRQTGNDRITASGLALGTPAYMSPEQALGEGTLDGRSDLYSVGCVLFEMLTGSTPYVGDDVLAITAQKLVDPLPDVRQLADGVPDSLRVLIEQVLAHDPAERHASAAELAAALDTVDTGRPSQILRVAQAPGKRPSIAVLPFVNMSGDSGNDFFSDGISEELTQALSAIDGIDVVARTSAFAFKNQRGDVREVGRRLGVSHVLDGSVRRVGDHVRITAELIATKDGYRVWSDRFDRQLDDVLAVQDEISRAIVAALPTRLAAGGPAEAAPLEKVTGSPQAYDYFLQGRFHWNRRTGSELEKAISAFHRAIELDPVFARAHAALADTYLILGVYGLRAPSVMREAEHAARVALALDPASAEAVSARGVVRAMYEWNWTSADADFRRAIALNPQYPTARQWYAMNCLAPLGRFEEAAAQLEQARALDPLSLAVQVSAGLLSLFAGDPAGAARALEQAIAMDQEFGVAHLFLGQVHESEDRLDEACDSFERAIELTERSTETVAALAQAHARAGRERKAKELLAELDRRALGGEYVSPALVAEIYLGLGDTDEAVIWLDRAVAVRAADVAWFGVQPTFRPIRSLPRFRAILSRARLLGDE